MASTFGNKIKVSIFGQSHSKAIGMSLENIPAGMVLDEDKLEAFLDRRAPGRDENTSKRVESDRPEFLSGFMTDENGRLVTCGAPISAVIYNEDARSSDYDELKDIPRPGHADFAAHIKYGGFEDYRSGGHFSGRLTAPLSVAGGIAIQVLEQLGIEIEAEIDEIGGVKYESKEQMDSLIETARSEGDSIGGVVKCTIKGVHAGVGEPIFDGVENRISQAIFGIPAVKGIEFGAGFKAASMKGSENNDPFFIDENGNVVTESNNAGGILGGIAIGSDIVFRVAFKPTPSIAKEQKSISYSDGKETTIIAKGRHDPCVVIRALPVVEATSALAILDLVL
ncbi:MAG: chorismate synthase [Firmicutes bacterium]|nr:chorismate synthase [Bacillota bacterium]